MKNYLLRPFIAVCLIILSSACSKIYDPKLELQSDILVVEGHMSNISETYFVKLSLTTRFNSTKIVNPLTGASVWVIDDNNRSVYLYSETGKGYYSFSPSSDEIGITGHSYSLHIRTASGDTYVSSSEIMSSPVQIDSVYGIKKTRTELVKSPNGSSVFNVKRNYFDLITDIHSDKNTVPRVRFDPCWIFEMIDYHRDVTGGAPEPPTYSWTSTVNNSLAITEPADNNTLPEQCAGSLLIDNISSSNANQELFNVILVMNYYTLNDDSYSFYNEMNKQLSSDDALFDPIAQQIEGNMKCENKPEKQAAGLFEVSSHKVAVYIMKSISANSMPRLKNVQNFHGLPEESEGKTEGVPPEWWLE